MRIFKEEQRFTHTRLIILLCIFTMFSLLLITKFFLQENNMGLLEFISIISLILISVGLIFIFKLKTRIDKTGIHYQFFPFHFKMKTILWKNIKLAETKKYDALSEYGGWVLKGGLLLWKKKNRMAININMKENMGILVTLNNRKKILIGTQKRFDVDNIIAKYLRKK
ncbi:hypothetical protein Q4Q35_12040 [Flavivirga aquimarina]|uniref:Bacterial Pleckstrin homology domain-containing protein n=1 Tax=Flavivirga aquimarina TaxID=2027862 RepID=A0ABT8WBV5_9FLAO|nr:hypothetical protein [Flavivirga aquimarina]MDO5970538.1 hypothetical protein [Flavivirga aquimarina]